MTCRLRTIFVQLRAQLCSTLLAKMGPSELYEQFTLITLSTYLFGTSMILSNIGFTCRNAARGVITIALTMGPIWTSFARAINRFADDGCYGVKERRKWTPNQSQTTRGGVAQSRGSPKQCLTVVEGAIDG